jgi:hypothetical protein
MFAKKFALTKLSSTRVFLGVISTQSVITVTALSDTCLGPISDTCLHSKMVLLMAKLKAVPVHAMKS